MFLVSGSLARKQGRFEDAIRFYRRALERDPLSSITYSSLGRTLHSADRLPEAEAAHRKALELAPEYPGARASLSLALLAQGRGEEALAEAVREREGVYGLSALAIIHHALGHPAESDAALRKLIAEGPETGPFQIAEVHGARGETDSAFEWLERASAQRDTGITSAKVSPCLRSLHGDPRWGTFLKRVGLEE